MKKILLFLVLILSPFLLIIAVNESTNTPTSKRLETKCSRYCHNVSCTHAAKKVTKNRFTQTAVKLCEKNIKWLKNNPFGLSYQAINLVIYVFGLPLIMALLLANLIRKT